MISIWLDRMLKTYNYKYQQKKIKNIFLLLNIGQANFH